MQKQAESGTVGPLARWQCSADDKVLTETIPQVLRRQAQQYGERNALMWLEEGAMASLSYQELLSKAEQVAYFLLEQACEGARVAIWSCNSIDWAVVEYACALASMNVTGWNTSWADAEVMHAVELTEPSLVFVGSDTRNMDLLPRAERLLVGRDCKVMPLTGARHLSPSVPADTPLPEAQLDTPFLIQFTSGTTGRAKGAQLTHQAAMNGGYFRALATAGTHADVFLNPTPMHHIAGSVCMLLGPLSIGACYVIMSNSKPESLILAAKLSKATCFGGVPTMLIAMLEHPDFPRGEMKFRTLGTGGTHTPPALLERFADEFQAIVSVGYGQSECPLATNTLTEDSAEIIATTVGVACPGTDVKIVNPQSGETLRIDEVGEICVRSAAVMSGYYNAPEATAKAFDEEGFLRTGDLASMDEKGYLRIQGRAREVIIRGGENIYPTQVEQALHRHSAVSLAAVIGVEDEKWGQQVAAVIRLAPGCSVTEEELTEFLQGQIAHFNIPRYWRFVESFPMTASGKVRKVELPALFETPQTAGASE